MTISIDFLLIPCFCRPRFLQNSLRESLVILGRVFLRLIIIIGVGFAMMINAFFYCILFTFFLIPEWIWLHISKWDQQLEQDEDYDISEVAVDGDFEVGRMIICGTDEISELELDLDRKDEEAKNKFVETEPRVREWLLCTEGSGRELVDVDSLIC